MNQNQHSDVQSDAGLNTSPAFDAVCNALHEIVSEGIDVHRCLASKALGRIGTSNSVPTLITALLDEDEDVRSDAAEALHLLGDPQACDQLFENLLGDPCTEVKLAAIRTLAKLQDRRVIPSLRRLVAGRDEEIIWDEAEFYASGWDDWVDVQIAAVKALAELGVAEAVPDIVSALQDENSQDMAEVAFRALARMGPDGIDALAGYLELNDVRLRRRAASVLATIEGNGAPEAFAKALIDPSEEVRLAALKARSGCDPRDPALAGSLSDADPGVRAEAALLIGRFHSETLYRLLDDLSPKVRTASILAFAGVEEFDLQEQLIDRLLLVLDSSAAEVAAAAASTLSAIAPDAAFEQLITQFGDAQRSAKVRRAALRGLTAKGGKQVVQSLVDTINDDNRQIRLETMTALAKLAGGDGQGSDIARTALLDALGGAHDPEELEVDEMAAVDSADAETEPDGDESEHSEDAVETIATSTLDSILSDAPGVGSAAGLPEAGVELTDNDMERLALARSVVGKKKIAISQDVVRHQDIRRYAARVLGDLSGDDLASALADALELEDRDTRLAAADSLARIGARTGQLSQDISQKLLDGLSSEDRDLKVLLVRALAACDDEQATQRLRELLGNSDSFVRSEAVKALCRRQIVGTEIHELLQDPDPAVRMSAAEAIAQSGEKGTIPRLVDFALSFEGYHGRQTARLLRNLDATQASATFLRILDDPEQKRVWSVVIGALEELNQKQTEVWQH
ncbi:MAG: hypothetical protein GY952_16330 [Rhodobacteraceae bacterium]|nr:hypothetical protein [Paracoccaceae bacterium]